GADLSARLVDGRHDGPQRGLRDRDERRLQQSRDAADDRLPLAGEHVPPRARDASWALCDRARRLRGRPPPGRALPLRRRDRRSVRCLRPVGLRDAAVALSLALRGRLCSQGMTLWEGARLRIQTPGPLSAAPYDKAP